MVEIFNQYFASVFTVEDTEHIPTAELSFRGGDDDKLCDIYIDESVVKKKLDSLHIDKAAGADDISPREFSLRSKIPLPSPSHRS